jgi:hypothetical protein
MEELVDPAGFRIVTVKASAVGRNPDIAVAILQQVQQQVPR